MAEDSYRVMGVCVWEGDVMICHTLGFRTQLLASPATSRTQLSPTRPKHIDGCVFTFDLVPFLLFREGIVGRKFWIGKQRTPDSNLHHPHEHHSTT